ncbi:protein FAR1-RELATED SEQUENCE 5-like [Camellia sinensis]|uniref:protein FAR1-RELATED SEQUENCE 5-like n=1 Tax=Camellia sinensis TaxID=4442 RepID=UPI001036EBE9|nr:protein FAR1-RELATED SEQUENCE 5-like [Camellia sinensis]
MEDNTEQNKNTIIYELDDDNGNDGKYNIHNEDNNVNSNDILTKRDIKHLDELTENDVFEMTFDSEENGERFFNSYAKVKDNTEQNKNTIIYELDDDNGNDGKYNIHNEDNNVNSNDILTKRDIKHLDELTENDVFEMTFDSEENGERFFNSYAKVKGFSIRRDQLYKDKNNMVISRNWVCSKEGHRQSKYLEIKERKREPKQLTKVGCRACFCIKYNRRTSKYEMNEFFKEHNHSMIRPLGVQFLRSHRNVTSADKA